MQICRHIRSFQRDNINTLVIIISHVVSIASLNLIVMFLSREISTDKFHKKWNQIYALKCEDPWFPGKKIYFCKSGSAEFIRNNIPQVEDYCRIKIPVYQE